VGEGEEEEEEGVGVGVHGCGCGCGYGCGCGRAVVKEVGWGFEWRGWWWGLVEKSWMYGFLLILFRFLEDASCLCVISTNLALRSLSCHFPRIKKPLENRSLFSSYDCSSPPYHVLL